MSVSAYEILNMECSLKLDLQFFAKEGPGGEKTEQATPKKLEDARKEGQVAKSRELGNAFSLFALFISLRVFSGTVGYKIMGTFSDIYNRIPTLIKMPEGEVPEIGFRNVFVATLINMLLIVLPIFAIAVALAIVVDIIQVGWKPTSKPLQPKGNKINPINGFKRMFSKDKLVELLKAIIKITLIVYIAYSTIKGQVGVLFTLYDLSLLGAIQVIGNVVIGMGLRISFFYLVLGLIDYGYQKWKFGQDMMMTKQEVKDEMKDAEGDPQIKGQQKRRMQEASRRRMMQQVPQADVVITNPTHFAVALKYDPEKFDAPYVVAKGEDFLAARIKEKARENNVEIVENKPLARMIYYNVDLGYPIPPELYHTVADILAAVYNTKKRA
ncbi:MAG: flagellar biosynthesis protein FlhB [Lachnospiraceae bacterium]|nr:flagellar biosynthesis protein FlhB [Lachnospiraceae bacterium]